MAAFELPGQLALSDIGAQSSYPLVPDQGETEDDLRSPGSGGFDAAIASSDWTVETVVSQMRKDRIDLNPRFQRRNAWVDHRKSSLIESVILGYPIPQIVLAELPDSKGRYFVIDGKQRLLALRQFSVDDDNPKDEGFRELRLQGLKVLKHLNGMYWRDIQREHPGLEAQFENHTIRTVFLSGWNDDDLLLSLFLRLNTGSVTLSPQELRQALKPGPFTNWLDDASLASDALKALLGNDEPDRRMVDAELLLRHLALRFSPIRYRGNLRSFLDETTGTFNDHWGHWQAVVEQGLADLEEAIAAMFQVFPEEAVCRKWTTAKWERPLNRAVFDLMALAFSDGEVRDSAPLKSPQLVQRFQHLCDEDRQFSVAITSTTKTGNAFRTRVDAWHRVVLEVLGVSFERPSTLYGEI